MTRDVTTSVTQSLANRDLIFGALADPIHDQLHGRSRAYVPRYKSVQASADAITRLAIRQLLTDAEVRRARLRLLKQIRRVYLSTLKG